MDVKTISGVDVLDEREAMARFVEAVSKAAPAISACVETLRSVTRDTPTPDGEVHPDDQLR